MEEIKQFIKEENIDIFNIQETWISENSGTKCPLIQGYKTIISYSKSQRGGGLLCWVKDELNPKTIDTKAFNQELEYIIFKVMVNEKQLKMGNIYLHPTATEKSVEKLEEAMESSGSIDIITGDFNAHYKTWSTAKQNRLGISINRMLTVNNYKNINKERKFTHFNSRLNRGGSPDIVAVKKYFNGQVTKFFIGRDISSDHLPMLVEINISTKSYVTNNRKHWIYNKCNKERFKDIVESEWKEVETSQSLRASQMINIDDYYKKFKDILIRAATQTCPKTNGKFKYKGNLWWNEECAAATKKKNKMRREMLNNGSFASRMFYKRQYNRTRNILRKAKKTILGRLCKEY